MDNEDLMTSGRVHEYIHGTIGHSIQFLEAKAAIILGLSGTVIAYALREFLSVPFHMDLSETQGVQVAVGLSSAVVNALAFAFAFWCVRPRFSPPGKGIIFFGSVAVFRDAEAYAQSVLRLSGAELSKAMLSDAYALARIARSKARWTTIASILLGAGVVLLGGAKAIPVLAPLFTSH